MDGLKAYDIKRKATDPEQWVVKDVFKPSHGAFVCMWVETQRKRAESVQAKPSRLFLWKELQVRDEESKPGRKTRN